MVDLCWRFVGGGGGGGGGVDMMEVHSMYILEVFPAFSV